MDRTGTNSEIVFAATIYSNRSAILSKSLSLCRSGGLGIVVSGAKPTDTANVEQANDNIYLGLS